jgi:TetR/AcrR family transcriptional repressor of nem operon
MRYEKGHKETTRRRIVETAAARFRRDGLESVGVADLMAEAGLTHGGFYSHFSSKEDLVRAAMEEASGRSVERFNQRIAEGGLEAWIRSYLRTAHRDHPEAGCAAAALAAELARHPKATRRGFTERLAKLTSAIEAQLPAGLTPTQKKKTAVGVFATMIGAMQLARVVDDPALSDHILEAGIASALALARLRSPAPR